VEAADVRAPLLCTSLLHKKKKRIKPQQLGELTVSWGALAGEERQRKGRGEEE
jgi:hypothetical protein